MDVRGAHGALTLTELSTDSDRKKSIVPSFVSTTEPTDCSRQAQIQGHSQGETKQNQKS